MADQPWLVYVCNSHFEVISENRAFYSCVLSDLALSGGEAGVDLVLIKGLLLFTCKSCSSHASLCVIGQKRVRVFHQGFQTPRNG